MTGSYFERGSLSGAEIHLEHPVTAISARLRMGLVWVGAPKTPTQLSLFVADALVLVRTSIKDAPRRSVALIPSGSQFELAATFDGPDSMTLAGVLRH